jgi:hypothetical protein
MAAAPSHESIEPMTTRRFPALKACWTVIASIGRCAPMGSFAAGTLSAEGNSDGRPDLASELVRHGLLAVADAKDREAGAADRRRRQSQNRR